MKVETKVKAAAELESWKYDPPFWKSTPKDEHISVIWAHAEPAKKVAATASWLPTEEKDFMAKDQRC